MKPKGPFTPYRAASIHPIIKPQPHESVAAYLKRALNGYEWPEVTRESDLLLFETILQSHHPQKAKEFAGFLLRAISFTASPTMALRHFCRYLQNHPVEELGQTLQSLIDNPEHLHFLTSLFSFSYFFSEILINQPSHLRWLMTKGRINRRKSLENYLEDLQGYLSNDSPGENLREKCITFKQRELFRIGVREIRDMATPDEICREISALAQCLVIKAFDHCHAKLKARFGDPTFDYGDGPHVSGFSIWAMGKFGAEELNFSSDIDLIFLYDEEGETTGRKEVSGDRIVGKISNHDFFCKLSKELCLFLGENSPVGQFFRVDVRLRPDGIDGPLARSKSAFSAYLAGHARIWEKIPYLKAREIAGNSKNTDEILQIISRFVYGSNRREDLFPEIARLKRRIDGEQLTESGREQNIKRGRGGIREIEFIVSAHQLILGESHSNLRVRGTIDALKLLRQGNHLDEERSVKLEDAYWFFRRVEHTLQMMDEKQTHTLPTDRESREALALRCGFLNPAEFEEKLSTLRHIVRSLFEELFYGEINAPKKLSLHDWLESDFPPPPALLQELSGKGIGDEEGFRLLRDLAQGSRSHAPSQKSQRLFRKLLPQLLKELDNAAMPKQALRGFGRFLHTSYGYSTIYDLCLNHPPALSMLIQLFGFGALPGRLLTANPDWLDLILYDNAFAPDRLAKSLDGQIVDILLLDDLEKSLYELRKLKQREGFILCAKEILGIISSEESGERMSMLARSILRACAVIAEREVLKSKNLNKLPVKWCVLGLGGIGDQFVHYEGDLDVAFVVEKNDNFEGSTYLEWCGKIFWKFIDILSSWTVDGQLWKIDVRLRPEGKSGPICSTEDRYLQYYRREAGVWEWQALTKARPIAGHMDFGSAVLSNIHQLYGEMGSPANLENQIEDMRRRLISSVRLPRNASMDVKRSEGGIIDIEFLVQFLVLSQADQASFLFPKTTVGVLELPDQFCSLSEAETRDLRDALSILRRVQRLNRLLFETKKDFLTSDPEKLNALKRSLAPESPNDFDEQLTFAKTTARQAYGKYLKKNQSAS